MVDKKYFNFFAAAFLCLPIFLITGCSDRQNSGGSGVLSDFRQFTDSLDRSDMRSVSAALSLFRKGAPEMTQQQKDSAFIYFRDLYYTVINNSNERFHSDLDLLQRLARIELQNDPKVVEFNRQLKSSGMEIQPSEGFFSLDEEPRFLYENFQDHLSKPLKEFLRLRMEELEKGFSMDAALIIPFEELGERAVLWERYLSLFEASPLIQDAGFFYNLYLGTFLTGMDNSRIFEEGGRLAPGMKNVYSTFTNRHRGTRSAEIVSEFIGILTRSGYRYSPEVEQFYESYKLEGLEK